MISRPEFNSNFDIARYFRAIFFLRMFMYLLLHLEKGYDIIVREKNELLF